MDDELEEKVREAFKAELGDLEDRLRVIAQEEVAKFAADMAQAMNSLERVEVKTNGDIQIMITLPQLTTVLNDLAAQTGATPGAA